jgi:type IV secretory pathway TrbD component
MALAVHPFPRVLSRHNLLLGGEREPVLIAAIICGGVGLSTANLIGIASSAAIWVAALQAARWAAKSDPQMLKVYLRTLKYGGYYPAFSRPYRDKPTLVSSKDYPAVAVLVGVLSYVLWRFIA